jgi:hypothetical protein
MLDFSRAPTLPVNKNSPSRPFFSPWPGPRRFSRRPLLLCLALAALCLFIYRSLWETHIEIALYRRSWIRKAIKSTPPLSPTCFSSSTLSSAKPEHAPTYIDLSPGLAMRHGSDCYDFAGLVPQSPLPGMRVTDPLIFHAYWRNDLGRLGSRELVMLESLLATQPPLSNIILWSNGPLKSPTLDALRARFPGRIDVRVLDIPALATGTPIERSPRLANIYDKKAWIDGDVVRVLVLYNFGGIYVDMDVIVTRDLTVLTEHEWVEQWDCYGKTKLLFLTSIFS